MLNDFEKASSSTPQVGPSTEEKPEKYNSVDLDPYLQDTDISFDDCTDYDHARNRTLFLSAPSSDDSNSKSLLGLPTYNINNEKF